jgi:Putative adhesin
MTEDGTGRYHRAVDVFRCRAPRWIAAGLALLVACATLVRAPAQAAATSVDVGDQAIVRIFVKGRENEVTVRTWDRSTVQVDSDDPGAPTLEHRVVTAGTPAFPLSATIGPFAWVQRADGQTVAQGMFPPEDFPYALLRPGNHDSVRVTADEGSHLVVTVPASTGILWVQVGTGTTTIQSYRGANLFVVQNAGRVRLHGVATTAFAQMAYGTLRVTDSAFDRIRVRDNAGQVIFERSRAKQIEASTISGNIVYDGGSFDPGLARFESQSGDIALGTVGTAQIIGRSGDGHVFTQFDHRTNVDQRSDGQAIVNVGGAGGPLVNAISNHGNVYLYDGSLRGRPLIAPEWQPLQRLFILRRRVQARSVPDLPTVRTSAIARRRA